MINCKVNSDQVFAEKHSKPRKGKRGRTSGERTSAESESGFAGAETLHKVSCSVCSTEVGIIDQDEVYHFFNVLPSES